MADATVPTPPSPDTPHLPQPLTPPFNTPPANRLSIAHLLLWTFCCAAILGGYRSALEWQFGDQHAHEAELAEWLPDGAVERQSRDNFVTRLLIFYAFYSLPLGARAAGALLWGYRWATGKGGRPSEPGHWLLIAGGAEAILALAGQMLAFAILVSWGEPADSWWVVWFALLYLPGLLAGIALYVIAVRRQVGHSKAWRAAFIGLLIQRFLAVIVLVCVTMAIWSMLWGSMWGIQLVSGYSFCSCLEVVIVGLVVVAAFGDPDRSTRDFLHWVGVNALIAAVVIQWVQNWGLPLLM